MNKLTVTALACVSLLIASCGTSQKSAESQTAGISANSGDAVVSTAYGDIAGYRQDGINVFKL